MLRPAAVVDLGAPGARITTRERLDARDSSENTTRRLAHQDQRRRAWKMDHERKRKAEWKQRQLGR